MKDKYCQYCLEDLTDTYLAIGGRYYCNSICFKKDQGVWPFK